MIAGWAVGTPYADRLVHTVRVSTRVAREPAPVVLHRDDIVVRDRRSSPWRPHFLVASDLVLALIAFLLNLTPAMVIAVGVATILGIQITVAVDRGRLLAEELARPPSIEQVAFEVADALRDVGLSPVGAEAVAVVLDEHLERRCSIEGVEAEVSATFAAAFDEVVSPMASTRYVVPRWVLQAPGRHRRGAAGRARPAPTRR